jgi:hypothetical protein
MYLCTVERAARGTAGGGGSLIGRLRGERAIILTAARRTRVFKGGKGIAWRYCTGRS